MSDKEEYLCQLDYNTVEKAKVELHEFPEERLGAVDSLRQWVDEQKWLNAPTGKFENAYIIVKCLQIEGTDKTQYVWLNNTCLLVQDNVEPNVLFSVLIGRGRKYGKSDIEEPWCSTKLFFDRAI